MNSQTPFPQANDLGKILKLVLIFDSTTKSKKKEILKLSTDRQLDYYINAAIFLELLENRNLLSDKGDNICRQYRNYQKKEFILMVLKNKLIKNIVFNYNEESIDSILNKFITLKDLSPATIKRRKSTIKSWRRWLNNNI